MRNKQNQEIIKTRRICLVTALLLILAGVFNGSMADVLAKASAVCTECIGLG